MYVGLYKNRKSDIGYEKEAKEKLIDRLLVDKLEGSDKLTDIDAIDMETKAPMVFIPSMFYTFIYGAGLENIGSLLMEDKLPLILCMSNKGKTVSGLNFNMLPNDIRAVMLDVITNTYSEFYTKAIESGGRGEFVLNKPFSDILVNETTRIAFLDLLENKTGVSIKKAYRTYKTKFISTPRLVEYSDFVYIPFLNFKDSIRGVGLAKVQLEVINK